MLGAKIGSRLILIEETDSTNSHVSRLLHSSFPEEGTVVMTHFQKAGRGQRGTGWESAKGENLLVSYCLYPEFLEAGSHFLLNQAVSLAAAEAISQISGHQALIKWPNDIILDSGKVAGILIENTLRNGKITQSIAGIGVNVNQQQFQDYVPPAVSIRQVTGEEHDLKVCLSVLSNCFDKWYTTLRLKQGEKIRKSYLNLLFRKDKISEFVTPTGTVSATIKGVTEDGRLMVEEKNGDNQLFFNTKEIKLLTF
jgi:BirA family biotin operon repressor/biotin-[acetyl-CoA-carboxylase] ligase